MFPLPQQQRRGMGEMDMSWLTNPVAGLPIWAWIAGALAVGFFLPAIIQEVEKQTTPAPPPPPKAKKGWFGF
jgi:hypothetical protein